MTSIQFSLRPLHSSPLPGAPTLVAVFLIYHVTPPLPCVHIHLLSSDRERHLWSSKRLSYRKLPCILNVPFIRRSFHSFGSSFFSYCVIRTSVLHLSPGIIIYLSMYLMQSFCCSSLAITMALIDPNIHLYIHPSNGLRIISIWGYSPHFSGDS